DSQMNAWLWWLLFHWRDSESAMTFSGPAPDFAYDGHTFYVSPAFWALGNFSKFVRPGAVRIGATWTITDKPPPNNPTYYRNGLWVSAYRDPSTDQLVVVAINDGPSNANVSFTVSGYGPGAVTPYVTSAQQNLERRPDVALTAGVVVPAMSVVTYVSHART